MLCSFDFHVHTSYSMDSSINPYEIVHIAKRKGLKGIAVTDHNTIEGGLKVSKHADDDFHVIVGSEIKTEMGEIIGIFLNDEIRSKNPLEAIDNIKSQGGLTILPHPFRSKFFFHRVSTSMEIAEKVDVIEVFNARTPTTFNNEAFLLATRMEKPMIAGSDAHFYREIGKVRTVVPSFYNEDELKRLILNGKTTIEKESLTFIQSIPFQLFSFVFSRIRRISQNKRL